MESLERTPTPRELLFSLQQHLHKVLSSDGEFYTELAKATQEGDFDEKDDEAVAKHTQFFNELYLVKIRDEDGEVVDEVDTLQIIKEKLSKLYSKINAAVTAPQLSDDAWSDLNKFLETEKRQIEDDELFKALIENTEVTIKNDLDTLIDWYNNMLTQTIKSIDRIYREPELDFK